MLKGPAYGVGTANSETDPPMVIRPILLAVPANSVNQRLPSGPVVMPTGLAMAVGMENSVMVPFGVLRPILLALLQYSVNQRLPSGPSVMPYGCELAVGMGNSLARRPAAEAKLVPINTRQ